MNHAKIRITKSERMYHDGETISNGHWLAPASVVKVSDKELQALVSAGVKFDRTHPGIVRTGEDAGIPDLSSPYKGLEFCETEGRASNVTIGGLNVCADAFPVIDSKAGRVAWFDTRYKPLVDVAETVKLAEKKGCALLLDFGDKGKGLLMPLVSDCLPTADIELLAGLLDRVKG